MAVKVLLATVQTKEEDGRVGGCERLAVLRTCEAKPRTWYTLSNARDARRAVLAQVHGQRHRVEELLEEGNGEVGLSQYEVRSWVGWHHHLTLSLLALWFLQVERLRLGGKNAGGDRGPGAGDFHRAPAGTAAKCRADCRSGEPRVAA
jgi:SRSO17 transposase